MANGCDEPLERHTAEAASSSLRVQACAVYHRANIGNSVGDSLPIYTDDGRTDYVLHQCAWAGQTSRRLVV
jgi:hypothetical protein